MGIKRGSFESVGLGDAAKSVNASYHERNSISSGLNAHASGINQLVKGFASYSKALGDFGKLFETIGNNISKARGSYQSSVDNVASTLKTQTDLESKVSTEEDPQKLQQYKEELKIAETKHNEALSERKYNQFWMFGCEPTLNNGDKTWR